MSAPEAIPTNRLKALKDATDDQILDAYFYIIETNPDLKKNLVNDVRHMIAEEIWKRKIQ